MPLVTLQDLSIRFRGPSLLDNVQCNIEEGQRIGLLGRNGAGKSTLMKLISGQLEPDHGQVKLAAGVSVSQLPQDVPQNVAGTVEDVIKIGVQKLRALDPDWAIQSKIDKMISRMSLDPETGFDTLSSGMKRRVLLAQSLVSEPGLLLLDEPTNHLDIESIRWLEEFLLKWEGTILFVTHDRSFLSRLATRILEIDRGQIFDWSCSYEKFLTRKENALEAEEKQNALFDKNLAQEENWIRQGIKARRTRNQGRVRRLQQMRLERSERRNSVGKVKLQIQNANRSGNLVAKVDNIGFGYDDKPLVSQFSTEILRGDKLGLIGPNGVGKSTLLKLLLGKIEPHTGSVKLGTNLEIAYFDQLRETLNENQTVQHNVADGYDTVQWNGKSKHVLGYLQDFLFPPERSRSEVRFLSGGERNRLLLARLFCRPANVLVMDEPTNDLDAETLELLEERLIEFEGTVLLVSHDRTFLNNVVTSTIAFENGEINEYTGGYDDYLRQSTGIQKNENQQPNRTAKKSTPPKTIPPTLQADPINKPKLSYREKQELKLLPDKIEQLETQISEIHTRMASPDFYKSPSNQISQIQSQLESLSQQLESAYERWEWLEARV